MLRNVNVQYTQCILTWFYVYHLSLACSVYCYLLFSFFIDYYTRFNVLYFCRAVPGSQSSYMSLCL